MKGHETAGPYAHTEAQERELSQEWSNERLKRQIDNQVKIMINGVEIERVYENVCSSIVPYITYCVVVW